MLKKLKNWKFWIILIILLVIIYVFIKKDNKPINPYNTVPVTMGTIRQEVTASGEINPVNLVAVGSQVSGKIEKLYVDYNDVVKKGQIIAKIDDSVLKSNVASALAKLKKSEADKDYMKKELDRSKELYNKGYIAKSEMDLASNNYTTALENYNSEKSSYDQAIINLNYATIQSPVSGTVISRSVDEGQTVAASFQTPEIFSIAEDLKKMQIETSVSEADIGMIKVGQDVSFTVDSFPNTTFKGKVKQIRLSPTTESNVVVYTVIIDVDNSDLRLMPGMTAFVTILITEKTDVLKAKNSAFSVKNLSLLFDDPQLQNEDINGTNTLLILRGENKKPIITKYKKGLATALESEIISDEVMVGDKIITGLTNGTGKTINKSKQNRGPMGGGPR